jgi:hypothetical protein
MKDAQKQIDKEVKPNEKWQSGELGGLSSK